MMIMLLAMSSFSNDYGFYHNSYKDDDLLRNAIFDNDNADDSDIDDSEASQDVLMNDPGLNNTTIELIAPEILPVGEPLFINIVLKGNEENLNCILIWYVNNEPVKDERINTSNDIPGFNHKIEYSRIMDESIDIKVSLQYITTLNEMHIIEAEKTVIIENYDISYWKEVETERVLGMVKSLYNGDFTLEWAMENDYDVFEKELYINANGYTSETEYLIWVNRCFQRANIFIGTGQANEWELYKVFFICTGGWINSTPRGVTTIPSRSAAGWVFSDSGYRVEPVVRFWPERSSPLGSSFAFHSRPLDIQTGEVVDERIGVPASSGCIRMYCDDVWWIFENIPDHTTVVVY